jgi:hypothetical protein
MIFSGAVLIERARRAPGRLSRLTFPRTENDDLCGALSRRRKFCRQEGLGFRPVRVEENKTTRVSESGGLPHELGSGAVLRAYKVISEPSASDTEITAFQMLQRAKSSQSEFPARDAQLVRSLLHEWRL